MRWANVHGRLLVSVVVLMALAAVVLLLVPPLASQSAGDESSAPPPPKIEAKKAVLDGHEVGEVWINDKVVVRLQQAAGGLSPFQRAEKVAQRIKDAVAGGKAAEDFHAGSADGYAAVLAGNDLVITADRFHAQLNGVEPASLADTWAGQIRGALSGSSGAPTGESEVSGWSYREEDYGDKWVPILSAGDGIHIGAARVAGPKTNLADVQGVALVELNWDKFTRIKIRVYVPISTTVPGKTLARVQRCNVTAVGDFRL